MYESDVAWIETVVRLSNVFLLIFFTEKSVGFRKIWKWIPPWLPAAILYVLWRIFNELYLNYPQIIRNMIPETMAYEIWAGGGLILMLIIMPWFYKGSVLERYFVCFVIEVMAIYVYLCEGIGMLLVRNTGLYGIAERNVCLLLILRLLLEYAPAFLFYIIFKKQFENYHTYVLKHKKICWVATVLVVGGEAFTPFIAASKELLKSWRGITNPIILLGVITIVIYLLRRENERMNLQKQFMENHYQSVKGQEEQIAGMRSKIEELVKSAEFLENQMEYSEGELKSYEMELRRIHSRLQRVDYCDNLLLDAVLHNKARECEEKKISLDIGMQDVKYGKIQDMDMFEILYAMLEIAIDQAQQQENKRLRYITISGKNLAGQVVVEAIFPAAVNQSKESKKQYRHLKRKVRRLEGQCVRNEESGIERIIVGMIRQGD